MKPIIIIGAGGHARVLFDLLRQQNREVIGFTEKDLSQKEKNIHGVPILGDDQVIFAYHPKDIELVNGLGTLGMNARRKEIFCDYQEKNYHFATLIHPSAIVADDVQLDEGVQIMAGAIIQTGSRIGSNTIINTASSIDHDCQIGSHVHIAPGCTLSGSVFIDDNVHLGTGAIIIQGIAIGYDSLIAAGAVVVNDILAETKVKGIPAREVRA